MTKTKTNTRYTENEDSAIVHASDDTLLQSCKAAGCRGAQAKPARIQDARHRYILATTVRGIGSTTTAAAVTLCRTIDVKR